MIQISDTIQLEFITLKDHLKLMALMQKIYPPAYKHLWINENTDWYLDYSFNINNLKAELTNNNSGYYFVLYNQNEAGILRLAHREPLLEFPEISATYIHRIYLSGKLQGKGVGSQLLEWSQKQALEHNSKLIWLKAMDTQVQALRFYNKQGFKTINTFTLDFELIHQHLRGMVTMYKTL